MAEKALKAVEVFFDTVNSGEAAIMGFRMSRPMVKDDPDSKVVTFFFDTDQLDWLIYQMTQYVLTHADKKPLWTPRKTL